MWFNYRLVDDFMKDWMIKKQELANGKISGDEYLEWKLKWPDNCEDCKKGIKERMTIYLNKKELLYYMDECYNTGNNWLDESQPFFTYGGWVVAQDDLCNAKNVVKDFSKYHQGELKSRSFTSHKGITEVNKLASKLITTCNAAPYYICFEKNFLIACKAVEIFFDHKTNCKVNGFLTFPNQYEYFQIKNEQLGTNYTYADVQNSIPPIKEIKRSLAELIASDNNLCLQLGRFLNKETLNSNCISKIISDIHSLFSRFNLTKIANIFSIENFDINTIFNELRGVEIEFDSKKVTKYFLIQPSIYELVSNLRSSLEFPQCNLKLIVDTLGEQNFQFQQLGSLLNITIDIIENSKNEELIMASDLLVGQFARLIKDIVTKPQKINNKDIELLENMFLPRNTIFEQTSTMWYFKFSTNTWNKLCAYLNSSHFSPDNTNYTGILTQHFYKCLKP